MSDKSSETCLGTLKEIFNDISHTTSLKVGYQILMNIKNTMSDRAATEKSFIYCLQISEKKSYHVFTLTGMS